MLDLHVAGLILMINLFPKVTKSIKQNLIKHHELYKKIRCKAENLEEIIVISLRENNFNVMWDPASHDKEKDIIVNKSIKIKFKSFNSREDSDQYVGKNLYVDREQLDALEDNQYYWNDLIGLNVYLDDGKEIGVLSEIIETGSNDVLVVKGDKEILVPYIIGESVKKVIIEEKKIIIDKIYYDQ